MPEDIIASNNPVAQQAAAATQVQQPHEPDAETTEQAPAESTVQISEAAIQQLNSERANSSTIPATLTGEVRPAETAQTTTLTEQTNIQNHHAAPAAGQGEQALGEIVNLYA